jgi:CRP-like cAMP-binding protein
MTERLTQSDAENFTPEVVPKSKGDEEILRSVLEKNYLFKHLDDRELNVAVQAMFEVKFNTGEVVLEEGAESTAQSRFYVLTEGFCTVIKEGEDEQTIKPNDTIGEIELMYSQPAACTIVAHSKVTTWALDRHTYRHLVSGIFAKKRNLYEEFLSKIGFLKPLSKRELVQLADALQPHTCEAGDYMIRYGQEPDWFYIIVEGVVEVYGRDSAEQTIKVCEFGEGDCVGELEFINNHKTVADVVAKTHLRAAKLNRQHFEMCMGPVKDLLARAREGDEKFSYYQNRMAGG